ncbi:hypothetical protein [Glutamicibacter arilaitensis]|jgi:hypothetical protein|uniref:hypothetical protein n=1 Tax=Glutamicibacter arilaitensis TaxID=256701 RepID=UPI003A8D78C1
MTSPLPTPAAKGATWAVAARIFIPALWLGLIIGISFIEAPLKFTAPGITIPLGLGIGRRVFFAMNMVEILFFIALLAGSIKRGVDKMWGWGVGAVGLLLLIKTVAIRPGLSARTDAVLAGSSESGSLWHYAYIGVEFFLFIALAALLVMATKRWVRITSR